MISPVDTRSRKERHSVMGYRYGALFDMDGVIVDNAEYHVLAFEEWCREKGTPFDREYFDRNLFGKQNRDIFKHFLGFEYSPEQLAIEDERKEVLYRRVYGEHLRPVDGLIELLHGLKSNGFGIAVATSGPPENVDFVLGGIGAGELFDAVVTNRDATKGKPDPQVSLLAADRLGLDPSGCVVFEDSCAGAQAAISAGAALIGVSTGHPHLAGSALMIRDFTEIEADAVRRVIEAHSGVNPVCA